MKHPHKLLLLLLTLALVIRLGWSLSRPVDEGSLKNLPDQVEYLQAAGALASGERVSYYDPRFEQRVYAARTPGYPAMIALLGGSVRAVQVGQCLLDVSTCLAVYLLARRFLDERRALFACLLVVFNPLLIYFCALVLTETLYVSLLAWSIYLACQRRTAVAGVLLCALSIYVRPSGLLFPAALAAMAGWLHGPTGRLRRSVAFAGVLGLAGTLLVLTPWGLRNQMVLGRFILLSTQGGITMYDGIHPTATGASDQRFVQKMPELRQMTELQRDDHFKALSRRAMAEDPLRVLRLGVRKAARTWSPMPLSEQFSSPLYTTVGLLYSAPLLLLALAGLIRSRLPVRVRVLLILPALLITASQALTVGSMRYRLPAEPLLAVLAAAPNRRKMHVEPA